MGKPSPRKPGELAGAQGKTVSSWVGLPLGSGVWPLTLCAVEPRPAGSALAFPVVGAAEGPVVAVARVDAVRAPVGGWTS